MKKDKLPTVLEEIDSLELSDFQPPKGLIIPFRDEVIILPIMQNETKRASGIVLLANGNTANDRKIGIVARLGPSVSLPIKIGMKIAFEPRGNYFRFNGTDGNEYLLMLQHHIYGAVTPETYIVPEFKDKIEKRNDARKEGIANKLKDTMATEKAIITGEGGQA